MSNVHSMTQEENERVCRAVNRLMESHNSQAELAATIFLPDGSAVSQGQISQALRGMQVGYAFARGVARRMGVTVEELLTGVVGKPGLQMYKELPGWEEAAQKINAGEFLPPYVLRIVGESYVAFAVERVDATFVYDLGLFWIKHAPISVKKAAEKARILDEERQLREEEERREERNKSGTVTIDRRSHVAPLLKSKGNR